MIKLFTECSSCRVDNVRYNFVVGIPFFDSMTQWITKSSTKILNHIGYIPHINQRYCTPPPNNKNTQKNRKSQNLDNPFASDY